MLDLIIQRIGYECQELANILPGRIVENNPRSHMKINLQAYFTKYTMHEAGTRSKVPKYLKTPLIRGESVRGCCTSVLSCSYQLSVSSLESQVSSPVGSTVQLW